MAVQISDLDDCSEVLANLAFNGSDGATWLARDVSNDLLRQTECLCVCNGVHLTVT